MSQSAAEHRFLRLDDAFAERLYEVISEAKHGDALARVTVVTPSSNSRFYLRRWIAQHGLLNVEFTRIQDVADLLAQEGIKAHGGRSMTRLKGAELVRAAVAETGTGGVFAGLSGNPTFLGAVHDTLLQIEAEQGDIADISFAALQNPGEVTQAIGEIWDRYRRLKAERNLFDRTQVASWAADAIRSGALENPAAKLAIGKLVTLAVAAPTPQYRPLWRTLTTTPGTITVAGLTGDERGDAVLRDALGFDAASETQPAPTRVPLKIVSATDIRSEVAGLIQRVVAAAESGVPFNRIAVYYGNQRYASRVRAALEMANIPVSGQPAGNLLTSPAGRFVSSVLEIASSNLARQAVGDWLATSPVKDPANGLPVAGAEWDRISRAARISNGIERWSSQLERFTRSRRFRADEIAKRGEDGDSGSSRRAAALTEEANQAEKLLGFVNSLSDELEHPDAWTWTEWTAWLKSIVERYLDAPEGSSTAESAEILQARFDLIGELDSLLSGDQSHRPDLGRFAAVVLQELAETRPGSQKLGRGVFVSSVREAAATRFEQVHILGMADGSFPSQDAADPLLPDHVREELNDRCGTALPTAADRLAMSRRVFLTALRSGQNATLYWSRSSGPGSDDVGPAQWLVEQLRTRPGAESLQAGDLLRRPADVPGLSLVEYGVGDATSDAYEYEIESVRRHVETQPSGVQHLLERDRESSVPGAIKLESERYGGLSLPLLSEWAGDVSGASHALSTGGEILSASRVESFAGCPLRYFFGYVLGIDAPVSVEDDFHMPPDRKGIFIHSVLELYLNLRLSDGKPPGEKTLDEAMRTAAARTLQKEPDSGGRVWKIESGEIRRQLRRWLAMEAELESQGFSPADAELAFGRGDGESGGPGLPPLEIALGDGTVLQFSGVIDRVDRRNAGGFLVIDYKSGSASGYSNIEFDPVDRGRHLQLALYSKAIEQFRPADTRPDAAYWFVLDSKQRLRPEAGTFNPDAASAGLANVLGVLHSSNAKGHFPPNPGERAYSDGASTFDNCKYCDFDRVCPSSSLRERMQKGHSGDPRLAPYFDLALDRNDAQQ